MRTIVSRKKLQMIMLLSLIFLFTISNNLVAQSNNTSKHTEEYIDDHDDLEDDDHQSHGHDHDNYNKCFVAIHGATLFQIFDHQEGRFHNIYGSPKGWNATASIPMFAVALGYKFSDKTNILAKVEFEYGGFGGHQHIHHHGGDVHMGFEKSGAVIVERLYITHKFHDAFKVRVGHMPVPLGQVYLAHEPTAYMAAVSAKADGNVVPREWQETGISILGDISNHWKYQVMVVTGFDADYFVPQNFVSEGRQNKFEKTYFTSPAFIGRLDYHINNWNFGIVGYWNSTDLNAQDQSHKGRNVNVSLVELDALYRSNKWHFLSNLILGNATNTIRLDKPIAKNAMAGSFELGFNINHSRKIFKNDHNAFWLFGRLDYCNPMMQMPSGYDKDPRAKELSFTTGINLFINENIAIKADYDYIIIGDKLINNEQIISLGAAFSFLPYHK